jgi:hypothetical protein
MHQSGYYTYVQRLVYNRLLRSCTSYYVVRMEHETFQFSDLKERADRCDTFDPYNDPIIYRAPVHQHSFACVLTFTNRAADRQVILFHTASTINHALNRKWTGDCTIMNKNKCIHEDKFCKSTTIRRN